jgi:hypothetical protein
MWVFKLAQKFVVKVSAEFLGQIRPMTSERHQEDTGQILLGQETTLGQITVVFKNFSVSFSLN